jgi:hypothetical protein
MLAPMRTHAWLVVPALLVAVACDKKADPVPVDTTPPASTAAPVEEPPKREAVEDVDVTHVREQLKCPAKAHKDACDILEGFEKGSKWDLTTIQSEEARYFGKAFAYTDGVAEEKWMFLIVKKVPLNMAAQGDLPLRVVLRDLDKTLGAENSHAEKLWWLLKRDDAVTKRNTTANYVLGYASANWDSAAATRGASTILHVQGGAFVRQGQARTLQLVHVEAARPGASGFDGLLVTLYPLSW